MNSKMISIPRENWHDNPYAELYPGVFRGSNLHRVLLLEDGKGS